MYGTFKSLCVFTTRYQTPIKTDGPDDPVSRATLRLLTEMIQSHAYYNQNLTIVLSFLGIQILPESPNKSKQSKEQWPYSQNIGYKCLLPFKGAVVRSCY